MYGMILARSGFPIQLCCLKCSPTLTGMLVLVKYDITCSTSGMFVSNNVMSVNEIWRKCLYNFKQRVTKSNNIIVNHVYHFNRVTSTIWKDFVRVLYSV